MNFWNAIVSTPVVGEASSRRPAVDASTIKGAYMTNDSKEEELRLAVPLDPIIVTFGNHQTTFLP